MRADGRTPLVFINYRRADEPFAAALVYPVLTERWLGGQVFLDTQFLSQRGDVGNQLRAAVRSSDLVLSVIGPRWAESFRRPQRPDEIDWVRVEIEEAVGAGVPLIPILVDVAEVPADVLFDPAPRWKAPITISSTAFWDAADRVVDRVAGCVGGPARGPAPRASNPMIHSAVDAMLRHVLPAPQRRMRNDRMIARVVSDHLDPSEWLRFVATANLPGRPNGSCVVWITSEHLRAADLGSDFRPRTRPLRIRLEDVRAVHPTRRRRVLVKPVVDLYIDAGESSVELCGLFADEAEELLAVLSRS